MNTVTPFFQLKKKQSEKQLIYHLFEATMNTELIASLHDFCHSRGIDIRSEADYIERKRNGIVPVVALRKLIVNLGFNITNAEFERLVPDYEVEKGIDLYKFVKDVENSTTLSSLQITDSLALVPELKRLKQYLTGRNTTFRELFEDFDPGYKGYVPENVYFKVFGYSIDTRKIAQKYTFPQGINYRKLQTDIDNLPSFSSKAKPDLTPLAQTFENNNVDIAMTISQYDRCNTGEIPSVYLKTILENYTQNPADIIDYYTTTGGLCNTRQFLNDLAITTHTIRSMPKPERKPVPGPDPLFVINQVKQALAMRHTHPSAFFGPLADRDRVTQSQFMNVLEKMSISISRNDILSIINFLSDERGVDLQRFFSYFAVPAKQPVDAPVADLRTYLAKTNQRIKPIAQYMDKDNTGELDIRQLHAILTRFNYSIQHKQLQSLIRIFQGSSPYSIRWAELAIAVDPPPRPPSAEPKPYPQFEGRETLKVQRPPRGETPVPEVIPILTKINTAAYRFGVQLEDEFRHVDSRHCGTLSQQQIYDVLQSFADLTYSERCEFFKVYNDGYYMDIVEDLKKPVCAAITETKRNIDATITKQLEQLKGALSERSISVYDILGNKFVAIPRAINLLNRYTPNAENIVNTFKDTRRPELVDVSELQRAVESVSARKVYGNSAASEAQLQQDLASIRQVCAARRRTVQSLFSDCPPFISFDEFQRRLNTLNTYIDVKALARIRSYYEEEDGMNVQKFCKAVSTSRSF